MPRKPRFQHRKKNEREKRLLLQDQPQTPSVPVPVIVAQASSPEHSSSSSLHQLHASVVLPNRAWTDVSPEDLENVIVCKVTQASGSSSVQPQITHSLIVSSDMKWKLLVLEHDVSGCAVLSSFPERLTCETISTLLSKIDGLNICCGQPDENFVNMIKAKKGKITSHDSRVACFLDELAQPPTLRTSKCEVLCGTDKCSACTKYRPVLRSMFHRWSKKCSDAIPAAFTNERYMNTPQRKEKMGKLKKRVHIAEQTVLRLQQKIERITREEGEHLDELFQNDLISIMNDNNDKIKMAYPEGSFARLFWEEQLKASLTDDMRQVRWHPCMIKWCLNLKLLSTSAYHALRTSGFVTLPSERTLRDYTSYFSNQPGFMNEIDNQLFAEVSPSLPSSRRYISIIIDEMKIKEGLVFNKHSGKIIGFTSLGDINDDFHEFKMMINLKWPSMF